MHLQNVVGGRLGKNLVVIPRKIPYPSTSSRPMTAAVKVRYQSGHFWISFLLLAGLVNRCRGNMVAHFGHANGVGRSLN